MFYWHIESNDCLMGSTTNFKCHIQAPLLAGWKDEHQSLSPQSLQSIAPSRATQSNKCHHNICLQYWSYVGLLLAVQWRSWYYCCLATKRSWVWSPIWGISAMSLPVLHVGALWVVWFLPVQKHDQTDQLVSLNCKVSLCVHDCLSHVLPCDGLNAVQGATFLLLNDCWR